MNSSFSIDDDVTVNVNGRTGRPMELTHGKYERPQFMAAHRSLL